MRVKYAFSQKPENVQVQLIPVLLVLVHQELPYLPRFCIKVTWITLYPSPLRPYTSLCTADIPPLGKSPLPEDGVS